MKYEFDLIAIKGVQEGALLYDAGGKIEKLDIKQSADIWWDIHHKSSFGEFFLKRKARNKYAGDKCFNFVQPYIRMYIGEDEIVFKETIPNEFDTSDACELQMWWDHIHGAINKMGYWLFDEG